MKRKEKRYIEKKERTKRRKERLSNVFALCLVVFWFLLLVAVLLGAIGLVIYSIVYCSILEIVLSFVMLLGVILFQWDLFTF